MRKKAVVIGAGQIGRGFIGERMAVSGYDVVFLDAVQALVDEINKQKQYEVIVLGEEGRNEVITGVRAVLANGPSAAGELVDADVVTTAIGPNNIPKIAPMVAEGIRLRKASGSQKPLTIIACENMEYGSSRLFRCVAELLTEEERAYCEKYVGFPDAEVSRIVVPIKAEKPLIVKVEKYMEWIVDRRKVKGDLTDIQGLVLTDKVEAYVNRKIFTLTGHAMLGYLGYQKGLDYIWQTVYDQNIFETVYAALLESGKAWSQKFQCSLDEFMEYCALMLVRFADQRVSDACARPCREPIRKLSPGERLIGPALAALEYGIEPKAIVRGIVAALKYDNPNDAEAPKLQNMIREQGVVAALSGITGLEETHPLMAIVAEEYSHGQN